MLKYWRILLLLTVVLGALFSIGFTDKRNGVEVVYVTRESPAFGVLEQGMVLTSLNGVPVKNSGEWNAIIDGYTGSATMTTSTGKSYDFIFNETTGIEVKDVQRLNLDFGLDIQGGTRIILKPKTNATMDMIEQVKGTLQTRMNIYGLKDMQFTTLQSSDGNYIQIDATGLSSDIVNDLLTSEGTFVAKISKPVEISNGRGTIDLGEGKYPIEITNSTVTVNGEEIGDNRTFMLEGILFEYVNTTGGSALLTGTVYEGKDIELIYTDPQHSGIVPVGSFYRFYFTVLVSSNGAEKFAKVTSGVPSQLDLDSGDYYLKDCMIYLYLDGNLQSSLRISSTLGGQAYATPQIEGGRDTREDATEEKLRLQTILRSGSLPVSLETSSISIISPTLGANFIQSALLAALAAGIAVITIIFIRYRSLRVSIPLVLTGLSEAVIILGISASGAYDAGIWSIVLLINILIIGGAWWKLKESDASAWLGALLIPMLGLTMGWNIDLPAIGGIIAAIGVGVDQMVVIADETLGGRKIARKIYTLKDRIGKAFFIIFTAAATTISALLPLLFVAAGVFIRGFVITTIVGILIGISISRPAYAKVVELTADRVRKDD